MQVILKTQDLTKSYRGKVAVNAVNITINKGEIYGFVGKNGAGKTTTMRLILGSAVADSGSVELFGSTRLNEMRRKVGSIIDSPALYKGCSAYENMKRFSIIYGGNDDEIKEILDLVGLGDVGKKKVKAFSKGMRQRLGIGLALLGNPELLILDEPINGLDPEGIKGIRDIILRLNETRGVTFMISSHLLDELGKIVTKYGLIHEGSIIEEITAEELDKRCTDGIRVKTSDNHGAVKFIKQILPDVQVKITSDYIEIASDEIPTAKLNRMLIENGIEVEKINTHKISVESYFVDRISKL